MPGINWNDPTRGHGHPVTDVTQLGLKFAPLFPGSGYNVVSQYAVDNVQACAFSLDDAAGHTIQIVEEFSPDPSPVQGPVPDGQKILALSDGTPALWHANPDNDGLAYVTGNVIVTIYVRPGALDTPTVLALADGMQTRKTA